MTEKFLEWFVAGVMLAVTVFQATREKDRVPQPPDFAQHKKA